MLEHVQDSESARKLLLSNEGEFAALGSHLPDANLLEIAVELRNLRFVAHRYCQVAPRAGCFVYRPCRPYLAN